jgi:hypothetical protein
MMSRATGFNKDGVSEPFVYLKEFFNVQLMLCRMYVYNVDKTVLTFLEGGGGGKRTTNRYEEMRHNKFGQF